MERDSWNGYDQRYVCKIEKVMFPSHWRWLSSKAIRRGAKASSRHVKGSNIGGPCCLQRSEGRVDSCSWFCSRKAEHPFLQALLLSHPRPQTRDTQHYAGKHKLLNTKYPALRNLVKQELDITIQEGEHSSVRLRSPLFFLFLDKRMSHKFGRLFR